MAQVMPEIANCPLCKNPQVEMLNEHSTPGGAYCCGVRCDSLELWNLYAAAMESQAKLDELRERVAWMMECEDWYNDCFMDGAYDGPSELDEITLASRVSVEEIMGHRITQRIIECAICKKIPDDGEYLWEMGGEYWCEDCCNKDDEEPEERVHNV